MPPKGSPFNRAPKALPNETKEEIRAASIKATSEDFFDRLGDNAKKVLVDFLSEVLKNQKAKEDLNDARKKIKARAKKEGIEGWLLEQLVKDKRGDDIVRIDREQTLLKARKAAGIPDLFDLENNRSGRTVEDDDADASAA